MFKHLREFFSFWIVLVPILAGITTWFCIEWGISYEMTVEASVFFVGIFFCFGIVMNTADERRFQAFDELALIKGNIMAISQMSKALKLNQKHKKKLAQAVHNFMFSLTQFLRSNLDESAFLRLDQSLVNLTGMTEIFRDSGVTPPEISRLEQFFAQINFSFEKLSTIKEYRTPLMLRTFLKLTLMISVFVLAPEFSDLGYWGIFVSVLITLLLMILIVIQEKIEHPFDEDLDDVSFDFVDRFEKRIGL